MGMHRCAASSLRQAADNGQESSRSWPRRLLPARGRTRPRFRTDSRTVNRGRTGRARDDLGRSVLPRGAPNPFASAILRGLTRIPLALTSCHRSVRRACCGRFAPRGTRLGRRPLFPGTGHCDDSVRAPDRPKPQGPIQSDGPLVPGPNLEPDVRRGTAAAQIHKHLSADAEPPRRCRHATRHPPPTLAPPKETVRDRASPARPGVHERAPVRSRNRRPPFALLTPRDLGL